MCAAKPASHLVPPTSYSPQRDQFIDLKTLLTIWLFGSFFMDPKVANLPEGSSVSNSSQRSDCLGKCFCAERVQHLNFAHPRTTSNSYAILQIVQGARRMRIH